MPDDQKTMTPGEWRIKEVMHLSGGEFNYYVEDAFGRVIATVLNEQDADAIIALPDLIKELERSLDYIQWGGCPDSERRDVVIAAARAALEKATPTDNEDAT